MGRRQKIQPVGRTEERAGDLYSHNTFKHVMNYFQTYHDFYYNLLYRVFFVTGAPPKSSKYKK